MKRILIFTFVILSNFAFGYGDLIRLAQSVRDVDDGKQLRELYSVISVNKNVADGKQLLSTAGSLKLMQEYNSIERLADLKLWFFEQTSPKIFVEIETADNATDLGYFRLEYRQAGKLGKLGLLKEYFNLK